MLATALVPLDGTELADRALPYATALIRSSGGRLTLLRVIESHAAVGASSDLGRAAMASWSESKLLGTRERLRAEGVDVRARLYEGAPATAIVEAAADERADLIVMSTHGRGGLGRWLYGSVADQVLRHAGVPVVLIPATVHHAWSPGRPLRVLVALDGSAHAETVLPIVADLGDGLSTELLLLRIVPPITYGYPNGYAFLAYDPDQELVEARRYLEGVAARLRRPGRPVETMTDFGRAAETIAALAREMKADLVAMATHGHGGLARLALGSVATETLPRLTVPLLLVRPAALAQPRTGAPMEARVVANVEAITSVPTEPGVDATINVPLTRGELELIQRGLNLLLFRPERDPLVATRLHTLLAKLKDVEQSPLAAIARRG